jgi:hypothetical protein
MIRIKTLALAAGLALCAGAAAHADTTVTGKWSYKVGANACTLTLTANASGVGGDVAAGDNCPGGLNAVGHWRTSGSRLQLISPSGNLVAILHSKGDGYEGKQVDGGRKIALSR